MRICLVCLVCCGLLGCGPDGADKKKAGGKRTEQTSDTGKFNPKSFDESVAWIKAIQARVNGLKNPLALTEAIEKESKEFDKVNGTQIEWQFPVTVLTLIGGDTPVVIFDGQRMDYGKNLKVGFSGGMYGKDNDRVFLKAGEHVTKDQYRKLKVGVPATVKGVVKIKFVNDSPVVYIFVEGTHMN